VGRVGKRSPFEPIAGSQSKWEVETDRGIWKRADEGFTMMNHYGFWAIMKSKVR
jgi:hypothetical protein